MIKLRARKVEARTNSSRIKDKSCISRYLVQGSFYHHDILNELRGRVSLGFRFEMSPTFMCYMLSRELINF